MQTQQQPNDAPLLVSQEQLQRDGQQGVTGIVPANSQPQTQVAAPPPEVAALDAYLQSTYGVNLGTAMQYVQQAQQQQQPAAAAPSAEAEFDLLKSQWQVDDTVLNERMRIVAEQFNQLPPEQQALYDNVDGVQLLWQRYERQNPSPTPVDRGASAATPQNGRYQFTRSQLYAMSEQEARANDAAITYAEANGLVHEDM